MAAELRRPGAELAGSTKQVGLREALRQAVKKMNDKQGVMVVHAGQALCGERRAPLKSGQRALVRSSPTSTSPSSLPSSPPHSTTCLSRSSSREPSRVTVVGSPPSPRPPSRPTSSSPPREVSSFLLLCLLLLPQAYLCSLSITDKTIIVWQLTREDGLYGYPKKVRLCQLLAALDLPSLT